MKIGPAQKLRLRTEVEAFRRRGAFGVVEVLVWGGGG